MRSALFFMLFLPHLALPETTSAQSTGEPPSPSPPPPVSFSREIAPVLLEKCFACHHGRRTEGGYRVDTYSRLRSESDSGLTTVPKAPDSSELLKLIDSPDPDQRMPKNGPALPVEIRSRFRRWIAEGAAFDGDDPDAPIASLLRGVRYPDPPEHYRASPPVFALTFHPRTHELVVGGYHEVTVWDAATGSLKRRIKNLPQRIQSLQFTPDGTTLVAGGGTPGELGDVRLIDYATGQVIRSLMTTSDLVLSVAVSRQGDRIAAGSADRSVRVFERKSGTRLFEARQFADWVTSVAFNASGSSVAAASRDHMIKVFDPLTGKLQATYTGHPDRVFAVAFDPKDNVAYSAGRDSRIHVWDPIRIAAEDGTAAQMEERFKKPLSARHISGFADDVLAVTVDEHRLISAVADGSIRSHDPRSLEQLDLYLGHQDWVYALAVDASANRLASAGFDGRIHLWELDSASLLNSFQARP